MRKFDTWVQHLKYKVLREVARKAWTDNLTESLPELPKIIVPGKTPTMRCCIYKERAIVGERIILAMGGKAENPHPIQVIDIACDECPTGGFTVTDSCRGCIAHRCYAVCKVHAISFDASDRTAQIDKSKCIECGKCEEACPFSAIVNRKRPCENACKVGAVSFNKNNAAQIDYEKCTSCGACVYQCPFGAISEKSYILDVIKMLKSESKVYALVAPAISGQFSYAKTGQVVTGIYNLGFEKVIEAAAGADIVAEAETKELMEKGFLTSSCCPAFVHYVKTEFPDLIEYISSNPSPMAAMAKVIKEKEPDAKVVFIGPCTAKKEEFKNEEINKYVDSVITFEELQALFDSRDFEICDLSETDLTDASGFGRIFAYSGGLTAALKQGVSEIGDDGFEVKSVVCSGLPECKKALFLKSINKLKENFIEGMACAGGCVNGAGCLTHSQNNIAKINAFSEKSDFKTIKDSVNNTKNGNN